jgi:hypothetical protein
MEPDLMALGAAITIVVFLVGISIYEWLKNKLR